MTDLISRQAAIDTIKKLRLPRTKGERPSEGINRFVWSCAIDCAEEMIGHLPSIDHVEHGEWLITEAYPHRAYCSKCYKTYAQTSWVVWEDGTLPRKYCPNCGAKMGEVEE